MKEQGLLALHQGGLQVRLLKVGMEPSLAARLSCYHFDKSIVTRDGHRLVLNTVYAGFDDNIVTGLETITGLG